MGEYPNEIFQEKQWEDFFGFPLSQVRKPTSPFETYSMWMKSYPFVLLFSFDSQNTIEYWNKIMRIFKSIDPTSNVNPNESFFDFLVHLFALKHVLQLKDKDQSLNFLKSNQNLYNIYFLVYSLPFLIYNKEVYIEVMLHIKEICSPQLNTLLQNENFITSIFNLYFSFISYRDTRTSLQLIEFMEYLLHSNTISANILFLLTDKLLDRAIAILTKIARSSQVTLISLLFKILSIYYNVSSTKQFHRKGLEMFMEIRKTEHIKLSSIFNFQQKNPPITATKLTKLISENIKTVEDIEILQLYSTEKSATAAVSALLSRSWDGEPFVRVCVFTSASIIADTPNCLEVRTLFCSFLKRAFAFIGDNYNTSEHKNHALILTEAVSMLLNYEIKFAHPLISSLAGSLQATGRAPPYLCRFFSVPSPLPGFVQRNFNPKRRSRPNSATVAKPIKIIRSQTSPSFQIDAAPTQAPTQVPIQPKAQQRAVKNPPPIPEARPRARLSKPPSMPAPVAIHRSASNSELLSARSMKRSSRQIGPSIYLTSVKIKPKN